MKRALSFHSQWKTDVTVILYVHQSNKSNEFQDSKKRKDYVFLFSKQFVPL